MKKTNQKYKSQKQRFNSILLALIWGATIMTGCKMAVSNNAGQTTGEVTTISIPEDATLASKIEKIEKFIIANKDSESLAKDIRKIMLALTEEREGGSFIDRLTNLSNIIPEKILKKNLEEIYLENKLTDDNYSNYADYETAYKAAVDSIKDYETYYNEDYTSSYNAYKESYDNYLEPINKLERVLNYLIDDFNDDNIFNFTAKESDKKEKPEYYKVDNLETILANAENPNSDLKKNLEDKTEDLGKKEYDLNIKLTDADTKADDFNAFDLKNKDVSAISFTYGDDNINDFVSQIDENTKTINFIIPSGPLSISSENPDEQNCFKTPAILENINLIKEKMPASTEFSISYADIKNTSVDINMDISFYNKDKEIISEILKDLPKLSLGVFDDGYNNVIFNDGNLYGVGIDALITKYYNANKQDKLSLDLISEATTYYFDAKEALNGKTMYTENDYNGNAYNLDINAALLMGLPVKNVEIIGTNKTDKTKMPRVTNVRVSADVSDITFGAGSGVIDFEIAPFETPLNSVSSLTKAKVIIRNIKEGSRVYIGSNHTIDLSNLPVSSFQNIDNLDGASFVEVYFAQGQENKGFGVSAGPSFNKAIYVDGVSTSVKDDYTPLNATNADWERAGNTDGGIPTIPQNTANVSQANVKSVKSLVMKRLLDDNQRVYG